MKCILDWVWLFSPKIVNLLWLFRHAVTHTYILHVVTHTHSQNTYCPLGSFWSRLFGQCVMYPGTVARSPGNQGDQDSPTGHLTHLHTQTDALKFTHQPLCTSRYRNTYVQAINQKYWENSHVQISPPFTSCKLGTDLEMIETYLFTPTYKDLFYSSHWKRGFCM